MKNPNVEFLEKIKRKEFIENIKKAHSFPSKILENFLENQKKIPFEKTIEALQIDFVKIVRGIKKNYGIPPPYGSLWMGENSIFGSETEEVLKFYRESNIGMDLKGEFPDHLGIELKFMSILCYMENQYWKNSNVDMGFRILDKENIFLKKHILTWVLFYLDKVYENAETEFYKGIGLIAKEFLKFEEEYIKGMLNQ